MEGCSLEKAVFAVRAVPESVVSKQSGGTPESARRKNSVITAERLSNFRFQSQQDADMPYSQNERNRVSGSLMVDMM